MAGSSGRVGLGWKGRPTKQKEEHVLWKYPSLFCSSPPGVTEAEGFAL